MAPEGSPGTSEERLKKPRSSPSHWTTRPDGSFIDADLHGAEDQRFVDVLGEAVDTLEGESIPYALIGGIASTGFGRPRWTHDIDVLVKPEDADRALEALGSRGFETEKADPSWLYKAYKNDVLVDIIFRSTGEIYLDREMLDRAVKRELWGRHLRLVPPEDLLIMKAVVHDEAGPRHWHDALGIIMGAQLDWDYLERRAMRAPRRVLSLLLYAHSIDLLVPNRIIQNLFKRVYES